MGYPHTKNSQKIFENRVKTSPEVKIGKENKASTKTSRNGDDWYLNYELHIGYF